MRSIVKTTMVALVATLAVGAMTAAAAFASGPPIVETKPATEVRAGSATLNGTVNSNGPTTIKYYFEYGTTTSYGSKTLEVSALALTTKEVSKLVSGLTKSTTYHFRIVATSSFGTSHGADEVFSTPATSLPEFVPSGTKSEPVMGSFTSNGYIRLNSESSYPILCAPGGEGSAEGSISITGPEEFELSTIRFNHCSIEGLSGSSWECWTKGRTESIESSSFTGRIGYVQKTPTKIVGFKLEPREKGIFAETVSCLYHTELYRSANITGSLIGSVAPLNTSGSSFSVAFEPASEAKDWEQKLLHLEGEKANNSLTWEVPAALVGSLTFEGFKKAGKETKIEVKA
jgi:hypothetical protein